MLINFYINQGIAVFFFLFCFLKINKRTPMFIPESRVSKGGLISESYLMPREKLCLFVWSWMIIHIIRTWTEGLNLILKTFFSSEMTFLGHP